MSPCLESPRRVFGTEARASVLLTPGPCPAGQHVSHRTSRMINDRGDIQKRPIAFLTSKSVWLPFALGGWWQSPGLATSTGHCISHDGSLAILAFSGPSRASP